MSGSKLKSDQKQPYQKKMNPFWRHSNLPPTMGYSKETVEMFERKSGKIVLCQELVSKLKLANGLRVNFIQDEDRPADWYIESTNNKDGILFKVDLANRKRNLYCAQKKALVLTILESLSLEQQSYRIRVSREEEEGLLPIITKSAKALNL